MLIRTFQIQIDGGGNLRTQRPDTLERQAGVNPNIHDVRNLGIVLGVGADQILRVELKPCLDAARLHAPRGLFDELRSARMQLAAHLVDEERNGYAPGALAGNAPVRAILQHAGDALLAPRGSPGHLLNVAQRVRAQPLRIHADEPLRGCAEDERGLVAPTVRIAVPVGLVLEKLTVLLEYSDDVRVRIPHTLARK